MAEEKGVRVGPRTRGFVKSFNARRGFGFINPHEDEDKVVGLFFHKSAIRGFCTVHPGQEVEFDIVVNHEKGKLEASDVTPTAGFDSRSRRPVGPRNFSRRSNGGGECYNCGGVGHMARVCTSPRFVWGCGTCGQLGHSERDCRRGCYTCSEPGHLARECPRGVEKSKLRAANVNVTGVGSLDTKKWIARKN